MLNRLHVLLLFMTGAMYPYPVDERNVVLSYLPQGWKRNAKGQLLYRDFNAPFALYWTDVDGARELLVAQNGETASCVGCHESANTAPDFKATKAAALDAVAEVKLPQRGSRSNCSTPTPSSAGQSRSRNAPSPPVPRIPATRRCRRRS